MNFKALLIFVAIAFSSPSWAETDSLNLDASDTASQSEVSPSADQQWKSDFALIIDKAYELTGIKYKLGGSRPETGFDCSQFVKYVFEQALNLSLPPSIHDYSGIFQSGIPYKVQARFGWDSVPENVEQAAAELMKDYFSKDTMWRNKFSKEACKLCLCCTYLSIKASL